MTGKTGYSVKIYCNAMSAIAGALTPPATLLRTMRRQNITLYVECEGVKMVERESEITQHTQTPTKPRVENTNSSRGEQYYELSQMYNDVIRYKTEEVGVLRLRETLTYTITKQNNYKYKQFA